MSLGVGRSGSYSGHGSGDIFLALSTAHADTLRTDQGYWDVQAIPDAALDPVFEAVVQSVDEAILNVAVSEPMIGIDGDVAEPLDRDRLVATLKAQDRWVEPPGLQR